MKTNSTTTMTDQAGYTDATPELLAALTSLLDAYCHDREELGRLRSVGCDEAKRAVEVKRAARAALSKAKGGAL